MSYRGKNKLTYDVIVHPTPGLYDAASLSAGLAAAGVGGRVFVAPGSYAEPDVARILEGQTIHFADGAILAWANAAHNLVCAAPNATIIGRPDLRFAAGSMIVLSSGADKFDGSRAVLKVTFTPATVPTDYGRFIGTSIISNARLNVHIPVHSFALTAAAHYFYAVYMYETTDSFVNVFEEGITVAESAAVNGIILQGSLRNNITVNIKGINTTTGNTGTGVRCFNTSTKNSIRGMSQTCDAANLNDQGSNNTNGLISS